MESTAEHHQRRDRKKVRQRRRHGIEQNVPEEISLDPAVVPLHREEESRDPDIEHADQRDLRWLQRIDQHIDDRKYREQQGKDIFHKEQRRRPLHVVDDPAPLAHDLRHVGEIGIQQHYLRCLYGRV